MIFALIALLALAVLAPLLLVLRGNAATRGVRDLALDLHRTQLRELDRDLAEGRILPAEHKTAVLEVQRRILAAAAAAEAAPRTGPRWPVLATVIVVPLLGFTLYAVSNSRPEMPSVRGGSLQARVAQESALVDELRARLSQMDPTTEQAHRGYVLLGNVEAARGNNAAAAAAYQMALRNHFDPTIAASAAEASVRAQGGVSQAAAALFRRALAASPNASWRPLAEQRLKQPRLP